MAPEKLDSYIMHRTHQALDIALQSGFLNMHCDNDGYPKMVLRQCDKKIMRSVMAAIMTWWAQMKEQYKNYPIVGITFDRFQ